MAKLVILLACVAVFNAVSALECYSCSDDGCKKDMKDWQKITCGNPADQNQIAVCQKTTYKVNALECYSCDEENCKKEKKDWQIVICDKPDDHNQEPACQKVTYKSKGGIEYIQRKCVIALKNGEALCPAIVHQNEATDLYCPTCKTNLCNSATTINFISKTLAAIILAILGQQFLM